jgi:hypothetical protein
MKMSIKTLAVYSVVGIVFALAGFVWWQSAVAVLTMQVADFVLDVWEDTDERT